jgi:hypothetical protein
VQEHLCRTLAHYLVYLASHLGLRISTNAERSAIDALPSEWHTVLSSHVMQSSKFEPKLRAQVGAECPIQKVDPEWLRSQLNYKPLASHEYVTGSLEHLLESLSQTRISQSSSTVGSSADHGDSVPLENVGLEPEAADWTHHTAPPCTVQFETKTFGSKCQNPSNASPAQKMLWINVEN